MSRFDMIRFIKGLFSVDLGNTVVVENAGGIGFEITVPMTSKLHQAKSGQDVKVFTYLKVQEDDMSLFGFDDQESLDFFKMLISVNGVGPKAAISIMSTLTLDDLKQAIISGDYKSISQANGIGKKTAERLILELKEKISDIDIDGEISIPMNTQMNNAKGEALDALVVLGYSKNEAMMALEKIKAADLSSEEYIKEALKKLF